ncbi:MAG: ferritin [Lentisphaerae bacterium]|nr:ferritin [Lentisphaerota bacterium]
MISKTMRDALNQQINAELDSAYRYLAMSSYAAFIGLRGVANWFFVQMQEELVHARKVFDYVNSQGEHAILGAVGQPPAEYESPLQMFQMSLANERKLSQNINDLAGLALQEKDNATAVFLQWFVSEQVEEENQARAILDMFKLAGSHGEGLFLVDKELATRQFAPAVGSQA